MADWTGHVRLAMPLANAVEWTPRGEPPRPAARPGSAGGHVLFVTTAALHELARCAAEGPAGANGLLGGRLHLCARTGTPFVVVSAVGAPSAARYDDGAPRPPAAGWRLEPADDGPGPLTVVGWYGVRATAGPALDAPDAAMHAAEWRAPWHVALVLAPGPRQLDGAFHMGDPVTGRLRRTPFHELAARDDAPGRAPFASYAAPTPSGAHDAAVAATLHFDDAELEVWERGVASRITPAGVEAVSPEASAPRDTPRFVLVDRPPARSAPERPALLARAAHSLQAARAKLRALLADARPLRVPSHADAPPAADVLPAADRVVGDALDPDAPASDTPPAASAAPADAAGAYLTRARRLGFVEVGRFDPRGDAEGETLRVLHHPQQGVLLVATEAGGAVTDAALLFNGRPRRAPAATAATYDVRSCADDLERALRALHTEVRFVWPWTDTPPLYLLTESEWERFERECATPEEGERAVRALNDARLATLPAAVRAGVGLRTGAPVPPGGADAPGPR